jgi:hypothetical protein
MAERTAAQFPTTFAPPLHCKGWIGIEFRVIGLEEGAHSLAVNSAQSVQLVAIVLECRFSLIRINRNTHFQTVVDPPDALGAVMQDAQ